MAPEPIQVIIYDAPAAKGKGCACGCGGHHQYGEADDPMAGVSMEMQARALAMTLDTAFPGKVQVEYIDVVNDVRGPTLPQTTLLCSLSFPTPLIYINGVGRFAGALIPERIRDEVEKILEGQ